LTKTRKINIGKRRREYISQRNIYKRFYFIHKNNSKALNILKSNAVFETNFQY
jgi:hypothetical protein